MDGFLILIQNNSVNPNQIEKKEIAFNLVKIINVGFERKDE